MSVPVRATLMAWFLLMARKLTRGHKAVEMTWSDVRQWLGKVAIMVAAVVEDGRENTLQVDSLLRISVDVGAPLRKSRLCKEH